MFIGAVNAQTTPAFDVLIFSKTTGFRHGSIPAAQNAFQQMASDHGFTVTLTEDGSDFNSNNLAGFEAVVFLMTTGDVLNATEQQAFTEYIQNGGGFMGVHSPVTPSIHGHGMVNYWALILTTTPASKMPMYWWKMAAIRPP